MIVRAFRKAIATPDARSSWFNLQYKVKSLIVKHD